MTKTANEIKRMATIFQKMWIKDCKVNKIEPYNIDTSGNYNESFIDVCIKLKMKGVKDYAFPLRINNTNLLNLSHFNDEGPIDKEILDEIKENFWFYFRRMYLVGKDSRLFARMTIADAIVGFFTLRSINTWLSHPRQTGATLFHKALASYIALIDEKANVSFISRSKADANLVKNNLRDDLGEDTHIPKDVVDKIHFFDQHSDELNIFFNNEYFTCNYVFISEAEFFKDIGESLNKIKRKTNSYHQQLTVCFDSTYASFYSNSGLNAWLTIKKFGIPFRWDMMNSYSYIDKNEGPYPSFIYIDTNGEDYDIDIMKMMMLMDCSDTSIYDREILMVREPFWDKVTYQELANVVILRRIAQIDKIFVDRGYMFSHDVYIPNIPGDLIIKSTDKMTTESITNDDLEELMDEREELEKQLIKINPS